MIGPEQRTEIIDQKPFVIRGHHLGDFALLLKGDNPLGLARVTKLEMQRLQENLWMFPEDDTDNPTKYLADVLGVSLGRADEFEEYLKKVFETFLQLPDNYPVEIVEGMPDIICGGCAIGEHCRTLSNDNLSHEDNILRRDGRCMDLFIVASDYLSLPKPTIDQEQAHFSDAEPQQVRRIKTTIGTVKEILKEGNSPLWSNKS